MSANFSVENMFGAASNSSFTLISTTEISRFKQSFVSLSTFHLSSSMPVHEVGLSHGLKHGPAVDYVI